MRTGEDPHLVRVAEELRDAVDKLGPCGAAYAYDPLAYAWEPHERYLRKYGAKMGRAVFIGMNPGPWGMAQTGVPFADVAWAHGWMGITGRVNAPPHVHPKRPVLGFDSTRSDPSGSKFYGWAKRRFGTADKFFERSFVTNYCPIMFLDEAGRNVPLPALRKAETPALFAACDAHIAAALDTLAPRVVLPMGAFVEAQVRRIAAERGLRFSIRGVRHPSPVNPANNAGWGDELDPILV